MAFKLTKRPRLHKREHYDEIGNFILSLTYREMTQDEKDEHGLILSKIHNHPKMSDEEKEKARREEYQRVAALIIVEWDGLVDDDDRPLHLTPENLDSFLKDPESRKFWFPYVWNYINPWVKQGAVEGEKRLDPQT